MWCLCTSLAPAVLPLFFNANCVFPVSCSKQKEDTISNDQRSAMAGLGNFDDGEGHHISILTPEGHIACTAEIADLQAQNASRCDAFCACRSAISAFCLFDSCFLFLSFFFSILELEA